MNTTLAGAKSLVWSALSALPGNTPGSPTVASATAALTQYFDPQCEFHGFHPINQLRGIAEIDTGFWQPLLHAMPNLERRIDLFGR